MLANNLSSRQIVGHMEEDGQRKALISKSLPAIGKTTTAAAIKRAIPARSPRRILPQREVVVIWDWFCGRLGLGVSWSSVTVQILLSPPAVEGKAGEDQ
jgi:hypothetical protein